MQILLRELEEQLKAGHVVLLFHFEEDEQRLILDEAIVGVEQLILQFIDRLLRYLG